MEFTTTGLCSLCSIERMYVGYAGHGDALMVQLKLRTALGHYLDYVVPRSQAALRYSWISLGTVSNLGGLELVLAVR